jgi:hypothetical protein
MSRRRCHLLCHRQCRSSRSFLYASAVGLPHFAKFSDANFQFVMVCRNCLLSMMRKTKSIHALLGDCAKLGDRMRDVRLLWTHGARSSRQREFSMRYNKTVIVPTLLSFSTIALSGFLLLSFSCERVNVCKETISHSHAYQLRMERTSSSTHAIGSQSSNARPLSCPRLASSALSGVVGRKRLCCHRVGPQ